MRSGQLERFQMERPHLFCSGYESIQLREWQESGDLKEGSPAEKYLPILRLKFRQGKPGTRRLFPGPGRVVIGQPEARGPVKLSELRLKLLEIGAAQQEVETGFMAPQDHAAKGKLILFVKDAGIIQDPISLELIVISF